MFKSCKTYSLFVFTFLLFVVTTFLFYQDYKNSYRSLSFAMLDVGQGDGLFIESPTGTQILIDGGPPKKILSALARIMSPFDKHLDAIIITNPDQDHIGGFLDVLKVYKHDDDKIEIRGLWPLDETHLLEYQPELLEKQVFVVFSHRQEFPENWPIKFTQKYDKPEGKKSLFLYELLPVTSEFSIISKN